MVIRVVCNRTIMDYNQRDKINSDKGTPYISEEPKFIRERYIPVAAVDIV